jgi:hypothetical protein
MSPKTTPRAPKESAARFALWLSWAVCVVADSTAIARGLLCGFICFLEYQGDD